MISKISVGTNFKGLLDYLNKKGKGAVQIGDTMGDVNKKLQLAILNAAANQNKRVKKKVFHSSLSLAPGEFLSDKEWKEIADKYMTHMGFENAHYVVVKHEDKEHDHIHICGSRIDFDGKTISDSKSYAKSMQYIREVEKEYDLQIVNFPIGNKSEKNKSSKEIHAERRGNKLVKTQIKEIVKSAIKNAKGDNLKQLHENLKSTLLKSGVNMICHENSKGQIYGLSYEKDGHTFIASKLGKLFQYNNIDKYFIDINTVKLSDVKRVIDLAIENASGQETAAFKKSYFMNLKNSGVRLSLIKNHQEKIIDIKYELKNVSFTASQLGALYAYKQVLSRLQYHYIQNYDSSLNGNEKQKEKLVRNDIKRIIKSALRESKGKGIKEFRKSFISNIAAQNLKIKVHKHTNGKIFGMSYFLKEIEIKASALGKEYQHNQLYNQLDHAFKKQDNIENLTEKNLILENTSSPITYNNDYQSEEYSSTESYVPMKKNHINNDDEYDEALRKKKKKRKGFKM